MSDQTSSSKQTIHLPTTHPRKLVFNAIKILIDECQAYLIKHFYQMKAEFPRRACFSEPEGNRNFCLINWDGNSPRWICWCTKKHSVERCKLTGWNCTLTHTLTHTRYTHAHASCLECELAFDFRFPARFTSTWSSGSDHFKCSHKHTNTHTYSTSCWVYGCRTHWVIFSQLPHASSNSHWPFPNRYVVHVWMR